ncbi:MAG TPA: efflux RND transporter periplasmic adaptor subunit [Bacteroidota bacterium]|nr:efflux RND transporter periplasmic adaptor subunit [Bacteroidota bacterium]
MKKFKLTAGAVIVLAIIILVLLNNRSKMKADAKSDLMTSYPVSVATVDKLQSAPMDPIVGTINANHDVALVSETDGKVTAVGARVGDYKEAGSMILQLEDDTKQATLESAQMGYEKAKKDFDRFESLVQSHAVTDQQEESTRWAYKNAEAQYITAQKVVRDAKISTPISGTVTSRLFDIGEYVPKNVVVGNVVDLSTLKVKVNVAEKDVFGLKQGDAADISTDIYPGTAFTGKITAISAKSDEAHTYPVEVTLPNSKDHPLKAGMFGTIVFHPKLEGPVLSIPRVALVGSLHQPQVYVVTNGIAKLRSITPGKESGLNLEVRSGLTEGETIVINGQNNLKDNVAVTVVK